MDNRDTCFVPKCTYIQCPPPLPPLICGPPGPPGLPGPPGIGLYMDYAVAKSFVKLKPNEKNIVTMQRILMIPSWSAMDSCSISVFEEGNYHWNVTVIPCTNGTGTGYVISTQVASVITDVCNPCRCIKTPILGTVQPFIHLTDCAYTTSGLTFLLCSRFEVTLELIDYALTSPIESVDVEVTVSIGKVVPFLDGC